jgi:hypothetical protein
MAAVHYEWEIGASSAATAHLVPIERRKIIISCCSAPAHLFEAHSPDSPVVHPSYLLHINRKSALYTCRYEKLSFSEMSSAIAQLQTFVAMTTATSAQALRTVRDEATIRDRKNSVTNRAKRNSGELYTSKSYCT